MDLKRIAIVRVNRSAFLDVLNGKTRLVLPGDAVIENIRMSWEDDAIDLLVRSGVYEQVPVSEVAPTVLVEIRPVETP